jgi:undecaprenyl-diphosphatase
MYIKTLSVLLIGRRTPRGILFLGLAFLVGFVIVTVLVFSNATQGFDAKLAEQINANLGSTFTALMIDASNYGREYFWIGVVFIMLVFGKRNTRLLAVELAVLFVVGIVAGEVAKTVAFRPRPHATLGNLITLPNGTDTDSSFPSGHALIVSIGALFALNKFWKGRNGRIVALLLTLEAAIVCYSRIYLGLHYPLDVIGGIMLGGSIVFIGTYVIEKYFPRIFLKVGDFFDHLLGRLHIPSAI